MIFFTAFATACNIFDSYKNVTIKQILWQKNWK